MCQICSNLTIKKLGWRYWPRSGVFIVVNFEHIPYIVLAVSFVGFEEVNAGWGGPGRNGGRGSGYLWQGWNDKLPYVL